MSTLLFLEKYPAMMLDMSKMPDNTRNFASEIDDICVLSFAIWRFITPSLSPYFAGNEVFRKDTLD